MTREERYDHLARIDHVETEQGCLAYLEVTIVHPEGCGLQYDPDGYHLARVEDPYGCYLAYSEESVGVDETLFLRDRDWQEPVWIFQEPAYELLAHAMITGELLVPIRYRYSGGFDYWGEWDDDLEVWFR